MAADGRRWSPMTADGRRWPLVAADGHRWPLMAADGRCSPSVAGGHQGGLGLCGLRGRVRPPVDQHHHPKPDRVARRRRHRHRQRDVRSFRLPRLLASDCIAIEICAPSEIASPGVFARVREGGMPSTAAARLAACRCLQVRWRVARARLERAPAARLVRHLPEDWELARWVPLEPHQSHPRAHPAPDTGTDACGVPLIRADERRPAGGYIRHVAMENITIVNALKKSVCIDAFYGLVAPLRLGVSNPQNSSAAARVPSDP